MKCLQLRKTFMTKLFANVFVNCQSALKSFTYSYLDLGVKNFIEGSRSLKKRCIVFKLG